MPRGEKGQPEGRWTTVIDARDRWWRIDVSELVRYRDLIALFIKRDFITQYKQTILGPIWFLLQPVLTTLMFIVVFGRIAQIPTDGVPQPLFYMGGLVIWNYFSSTLTQTSTTLIMNINLFSKVYFPRLAVPLAQLIAGMGRFVIQLALLAGLLVYFACIGWRPPLGPSLLLFPLLFLQVTILAFGVGLIVSALTTRYRDLQVGMTFGVQLWMYATPIVYPLSLVHGRMRLVFSLNPVVPPLEVWKHILFGTPPPTALEYALSLASTAALFATGLLLFNRVQRSFVDTV